MKLSEWELFDLKLRRENKPPSKALPADSYRNPYHTVKFESEKQNKKEKGRQ